MNHEEAAQIARDLEVCANAWEPGARLVGNVTAKEIRDLCLFVREMDRMISIDEIRPLVARLHVPNFKPETFVLADHKDAIKRLRELVREGGG